MIFFWLPTSLAGGMLYLLFSAVYIIYRILKDEFGGKSKEVIKQDVKTTSKLVFPSLTALFGPMVIGALLQLFAYILQRNGCPLGVFLTIEAIALILLLFQLFIYVWASWSCHKEKVEAYKKSHQEQELVQEEQFDSKDFISIPLSPIKPDDHGQV